MLEAFRCHPQREYLCRAHLVGELFQWLTGTTFIHVPYQGAGPAGVALMGGQVDLMFDQVANSIGAIKAKRLRALAVSFHQRTTALPDVPTMCEAGVTDFEVTSITGLLAPSGTPGDVTARLNGAVHKVLALPATKERFATLVLETFPSTPEQFATYIREDLARWSKVVKQAGIKVD